MNLEIQGLTKIDDIDGEIASSEDYDAKIELAIQRATTKLATHRSSTTITSNNSSGGNQDSRLKLPKLDIPKFDGSYYQWTSFVDLFDGAVDSNPSLSSSQKLFYLIGLLTGEAKRLLSAITITDANYGEARTMLPERYENRRPIVREHISSIVTASTATKEAGSLSILMQTADEHRRDLGALGLNMVEMDIYTVYLVVEKMDAESRRE